MSTESSATTAHRALESLPWRKTLSRAKHNDLVQLIADTIDQSVADVLAEAARAETRLAEAIGALDSHGTGEFRASADAHAGVAKRLRATADVRLAYPTLRMLAAAHPELRFDPDYRCLDETSLQIGLHSYTFDETLTALHAWSRHISDPTLCLDRPEPPLEPALQLTGQLDGASIAVIGVLRPSQPAAAEFLSHHPGSADGTPLSLEVLGDFPNSEASH